jgi:hypothetical protein
MQGDTKGAAAHLAMAVPLGGVGKAFKAASRAEEAVSVYQKTTTAYVGISNNLGRRGIEHGEKLTEVVGGLTRSQARGVEQAIIADKGLAKNGGVLTNKINSISPANSMYKQAVEVGRQILAALVK